MIALTQEKRQKRIDWLKDRISSMEQCRDEIPFGLSDDESMELSAYKDSLASLTAEPVAVLYRTGETLTKKECGDDKVFSICCKVETALYPAPPVQDIKSPGDHEGTEHTDYHSGKKDGWNECLAEIKRLNGWGE
ncbi:hypothetical protein HGT70_03785 [Rosenbergiella collisarenosi]|uniref:hypothetical protein n=1 Tax=Rosenbergiella collisarenosi TaxID=1544695 RepID=UPI001BD9B78F|nr:hypothetical protein [Rosenbergiella collisarenosi]MBT0720401.1 hypothetical protein [Rosenbergiella collisarenosi]